MSGLGFARKPKKDPRESRDYDDDAYPRDKAPENPRGDYTERRNSDWKRGPRSSDARGAREFDRDYWEAKNKQAGYRRYVRQPNGRVLDTKTGQYVDQ